MDQRRLFVAALVLVIGLTGGAALLLGGPGGIPAPTTAATAALPTSPVTGVIVAIDSRGLDDVREFTLRTAEGTILVFDAREMRSTEAFPLGHLVEHQATAEPVIVTFRVVDGSLVAEAADDG